MDCSGNDFRASKLEKQEGESREKWKRYKKWLAIRAKDNP